MRARAWRRLSRILLKKGMKTEAETAVREAEKAYPIEWVPDLPFEELYGAP